MRLMVVFWVWSACSLAAVHRTDVMLEPVGAIDGDSLLVVDLDNTVFESAQMLGSAQWFEYLLGTLKKNGLSAREAYQQALHQWVQIQNATEVRPVEASTPNFLRGLQTMGIRVMALSARPPEVARRTFEQLANVGVDFTRPSVFAKDLPMAFKRADALYTQGVLFADRLDKGGVLAAFFDRIQYRPKRVVYVDDQLQNVESVARAMKKIGVVFEGYRYGAADIRVKTFDPEVAELQMRYYGKILSDDAATQIRMLAE
ncbi:MAG: DUF2608 domain-containing protein [Bdellovibrionaceae bacterium]|nr:DUF2608 domain-containing protein [Pseudobdellovibrionaceae bacterium]